jgi:hypothetical protein
VASVPSRLPATILSRCQRLRIATPSRSAQLDLARAHKGPGPWSAVLDVIGEAPFEACSSIRLTWQRLAAETFKALSELAWRAA